ncbi:MAG: aminomethyl-transferring glycine dehydrogenase subunit GcvPB [Acholeplasmataceae bacterium]|jgi:glycine dehydrogenase subunit 2|nr:aminomethyl-transferring glycine dehydrogenase subunit GcvPB [Acholeplasmataceae bacterium]MCK9233596.1 aminomethyl-transferring glycine dehydrogenase subunit GcvPB [Acholeplasmataceae bacterium]MCK9288760.1 aminomethyl-transferring glycine dehydrogenase subunit GcvPB [Acholeplasmataceae bacterium]MCK9427334.1 aminomethyl-transferring glycine dehydrogenase subunit GcvPB [Acholeplasmataceae bacterium]
MSYDKLIFEISKKGRRGHDLNIETNNLANLPQQLLREEALNLPEASEPDVVRHYTNLSQKNFGVDTGFYPLGSCTMKYNPKINEAIANLPGFHNIHPLTPPQYAQGALEVIYETDRMLADVTGMDNFTFAPFAGAHGELVGLWIIKKYHQLREDYKRTKIIVPDSAHGTNPASAAVAGFDVIEVKSNPDGTVNIDSLKSVLSDEIAGIMLTNPNTLGIFEPDILTMSKLIHDIGGLLYYDGANLNPLLGVAKPGMMGFDIIHLNVHKTFSTPHGGGGPGAGPVGVVSHLKDYLPGPVVIKEDEEYRFLEPKHSIGKVGQFFGNFSVVVKTNAYLKTLGNKIKNLGKLAVLNTNYLKESLKDDYLLAVDKICMHEVVFDGLIDKSSGVKTLDIAKRLLDYGVHPPTIYFPLIVKEAMMIEPVETESKETLDHFIEIMKVIAKEARENPEIVKSAPHRTVVRRLDEVLAVRKPILKYSDLE